MTPQSPTQSQMVPLHKLFLSPLNQRQSREEDDYSDILPLIRVQGVLQNLVVVTAEPGEKRGTFGVVAGGRRWRCLTQLAREGAIPKKYEVPVKVVPREEAIAASLAENLARRDMHPLDEFFAFRALVDSGVSVEDTAARFGVTPLVVQRRLRLTTVSPRILDLYRADQMTLDQVMALALTDDHALQESTWDNAPQWNREARTLRALLTAEEPRADQDRRMDMVGVEAYRAAGGTLRQDLFADHAGYILDVPLLDRLVREKLEGEAERLRAEGWGSVTIDTSSDRYNVQSAHRWLQPAERPATEEEEAEEQRLQARLTAIETEFDAAYDADVEEPVENAGVEEEEEGSMEAGAERDDSPIAKLEEEQEQINDRLTAMARARETFTPEQMQAAGVLLSLSPEGTVEVARGMVAADADVKAIPGVVTGSQRSATPKGPRAVHSDKLMQALSAHRSAALQAVVAQQPRTALVGLLATMVRDVFDMPDVETGMRITLRTSAHELRHKADDLDQSRALTRMSDLHNDWNTRMGPVEREGEEDEVGESASTLDWLLAQDTETLLQLLAYCVASTIDVTTGNETVKRADAFARAAGLDMADWWTPSAQHYFRAVSKSQVIAAVKEAAVEAPTDFPAMKKEPLCEKAEALMRERRWLPQPLR